MRNSVTGWKLEVNDLMNEQLHDLKRALYSLDFREKRPGIYEKLALGPSNYGMYVLYEEPESQILVLLGHPEDGYIRFQGLQNVVESCSKELVFAGAGMFYLEEDGYIFRGGSHGLENPSEPTLLRLNTPEKT